MDGEARERGAESLVSVSGEWFVCFCRPFGGGLQTNRVPLFDSARSSGAAWHGATPRRAVRLRDSARTFSSRIYRPRLTHHVRDCEILNFNCD